MSGRLIEGLAHLQELAEKYIGVETRLGAPRDRIYARLSEIELRPDSSPEDRLNYPAAKAIRITFETGSGHQMITCLSPVEASVRTRDQLVGRIEEALAPYRLRIERRGV